MKTLVRFVTGRWVLAMLALMFTFSVKADAPTDIGGVITELGTYKTAAIAIGIALLLWILGRRVVKRFI